MPVLVQCLDPAIAGLYGELAPVALGLEHGLPVFLAVILAFLHVEATTSYRLAAVSAQEALRMVGVLQGVHTLPHDCVAALAAARR